MKRKLRALALVCLLLLGFLWVPAKSAIVVSDITKTEFDQFVSTSIQVWKIEMIAGYPSELNNEVTVTSNVTESFPHQWNIPEQVEAWYDSSGNLNARAGSHTASVQPTLSFNAILIQIRNLSLSDEVTEFRDWTIDGMRVRNLFAENTTTGAGYDQVFITGFNPQFFLTGSFFKGADSISRDSVITFTGIQIPEPNTLFFLSICCAFLFSSRKR